MAEIQFDASQIAPNDGTPDPIPGGWYDAIIDQSEMKPTKDGLGTYLQVRYSVVNHPQYTNRKVFDRLNLRNASAQAQEIAYGQLSAICHATGVMQIQDSSQLHNIPLKIRVKLKPADGEYEASNEITSVKHASYQPDAKGSGGSQQAAPAYQAPANNAPPAQNNAAPVQNQQTWQQPNQQQPWQQPAQQPVQQPAQQQVQQPVQQPAQQPAQQPVQQPPQAAATAGMPPWATGNQ